MSGIINLSHGSGGKGTQEILNSLILALLSERMKKVEGGIGTDELDDGSAIPLPGGGYLVLTIDAYTVNPPFFPGGNIGELAASGTINDLLMMGAKPIAMIDSIVVEEGFLLSDLSKIMETFIGVLREYDIRLIGGDFKVMPKGHLDKVVITTAGIGLAERLIVDSDLKPGDKLILTGTVGEHGAAILAAQEGIGVDSGDLRSDVTPLVDLMLPLIEEFGEGIHAAQDPTRGGISQTLNEWASKTGLLIKIDEERIPIREEVQAFTELLGIDPLSLACEGRALLGIDPSIADDVLHYIRELGYENASIIGEVKSSEKYGGLVILETMAGGLRVLEPPTGAIVPRIC